ncbi:DUF3813 domain-containing protein [Bacillus suaedaesalsae]|uniref:DUF3813 domain-containing protein n=1 Tax=Bacillus suaedaesalsae TaxID=2810349 RepID=A0ABS2DII9_9BACI|nr:DUF3813 domain-containing protein [Bacillus suaedaesalsae]MBM6618307.1 DUF3813 domain-containing protein [Bacillus suaedaesalsae]
MGNQLFQKARETVAIATEASTGNSSVDPQKALDVAKNALTSAYANSTDAEKVQLRQMQDDLDQLQ